MAFLGFEGDYVGAEVSTVLGSLAAELQGAQWALAWFLQSDYASLTHECSLTVHCDNKEAFRLARGGALGRTLSYMRV
eukprot:2231774-Pyramimonas_sp.AAC.1